jgi:hypothetical protein
MLFEILKLFGLTRMEGVRVDVEERFDLAKNRVEQAAQTAAILARCCFFLSAWLRSPLSV